MKLGERLDHVRSGCLLDHAGHRHDVRDLVRRGLATDGPGLPRLTAAGVEAWRAWLDEWRAERFGPPARPAGDKEGGQHG